ncbi:MAG: CSLREA domain-containing protein [Anaerolineaceae bacterium]|nr:CSLREA domain-containing protein [Anaerolineaceae bacterium]
MSKKSIFAIAPLLFIIGLASLAQDAMPQNTNNLLDNALGEPDITVNSTLDTVDANPGDGICADAIGNCTLRAAIMESNAFPLTQTIHVPAGTYLLTILGTDEDAAATGDLDITDEVLVIGDGQGESIIDGNDLDRVFHIMVPVPDHDDVVVPLLAKMTIQGGNAPYGGGILNELGRADAWQITLRDNYADGQSPCGVGAGAALYSSREFNFYLGTVTENHTPSISTDTTYGAIAGTDGYLAIYATTISNNATDWAVISGSGSCEAIGRYFESWYSLIANNEGGAVLLDESSIHMVASTITGHSEGIHVRNPNNSTEELGFLYLASSTIVHNGAYALKFDGITSTWFSNMIFADHSQNCDFTGAVAINPDFLLSASYSLFDDSSCQPYDTNTTPGEENLHNTDPLLLPLADNGGWTWTHAVAENSPAIGNGTCDWDGSGYPSVLGRSADQRGYLPHIPNNDCTVGAYEFNDNGTDFPPYVGITETIEDPSLPSYSLTKRLLLLFGTPMYDPSGDTQSDDVTNPANYLLTMPGPDNTFQTTSCAGGVQGDDVEVPISQIFHGAPMFANYGYRPWIEHGISTAVVEFNALAVGGTNYYLPSGDYTFFVCDAIKDVHGVRIDGDGDRFSGGESVTLFTNMPAPVPSTANTTVSFSSASSDVVLMPGSPVQDISSDVATFKFDFSVGMDGYSLLDTNNIHLIKGGNNGIIETTTCDTLMGDDTLISLEIGSVGHYQTYDASGPVLQEQVPFENATYLVNQTLEANAYRLIFCDSLISYEHIPLDGDSNGIPGGNFSVDFVTDGFVPPLPTPPAPTLNDYSDVLVALNLPTISDVPDGTVMQIERTTGGSASLVGSVDVGTTSFVDSNLICETAYRYRIRLYDAANSNFSGWSDYLDVTTANCVTSLQHTFGLYKEGQWLFYAVDGYQREDVRFQFGPLEAGWTALVGDWNGDGLPGIGLYKDGTFLLRDLDGDSVVDISFDFGPQSGAIPVVGDWDGNGTDTIGIFSSGSFQLRNSNDAGPADLTFNLGSASSIPLAGDWDGDGTDSVGYFENNTFYLATAGASPTVYTSFSFGSLGWSPVFGDWNGDLTDTIGLYNNGLWRLRNSNSTGPVDYGFSYGDLQGGWQPLAFDGDTSVLNRLFAATVPTPRVPVIPGPDFSTPTATPVTPSAPLPGTIKENGRLYLGPGTCYGLVAYTYAGDQFQFLGRILAECGANTGYYYYVKNNAVTWGWVYEDDIFLPDDFSTIPIMVATYTPTPRPTLPPEGTAIVTYFLVDLTTGPGNCYDEVIGGTVRRDDTVTLLGRAYSPCYMNYSYYYYVEKTNGVRGWIEMRYLRLPENVDNIPILTPPLTPIPSATRLPSPVPTVTPTLPIPPSGIAALNNRANLITGPGSTDCYQRIPNSQLQYGELVLLIGRAPAICGTSYTNYYYYVQRSDGLRGWIHQNYLLLPDDYNNVPILVAPATPGVIPTSPVPTLTPTSTWTSTFTPSPTFTASPTLTPSATFTASPTLTPLPTLTLSNTPGPEYTPPTATATLTPSDTLHPTNTPYLTPTPLPTLTPTDTPYASPTSPTNTPYYTPTSTP